MKLTKISLTNFRSFKDTQTIDLSQVTVLVGPNSVGKSSILMALAYVQQILEKGHCDPQTLDASGNNRIGGFQSLVNGGDLDKTIRISLKAELSNIDIFGADDEDYDYLSSLFGVEKTIELNDVAADINAFEIELEIAWSKQSETAFVKNARIWLNNKFYARIESSPNGKDTKIIELNTRHNLLLNEFEQSMSKWTVADMKESFFDYPESKISKADKFTKLGIDLSEFEQALENHSLAMLPDNNTKIDIEENKTTSIFELFIPPIPIKCEGFGSIPNTLCDFSNSFKGSELEPNEIYVNYRMLNNIFTLTCLKPFDHLKKILKKNAAIGPIRIIPDSNFLPNANIEQKAWFDGTAAWDLIYKSPNKENKIEQLLSKCSHWLGENKLKTGYELKSDSLAKSINLETPTNNNVLNKQIVRFYEKQTGHYLFSNQLGTGISQMLPLLVASIYDNLNFVSIEQPELHIHPRLQVELADLFLENRNNKSFLIETHSEHLILRLLKRIRQTTDGELPDGIKPVSTKDVSIVYLDPSENGVQVKKLRIDDDGEFIDRWPKGFFSERRDELM
ncbi:AAA family ATPase [Marinicellulosiphila megalodicopiae]|uniref:AAA family ATPase n=1 Tax=Marinicellulosiphila megalodicopiae TaxID=2724896 RepID=UPI003BB10E34